MKPTPLEPPFARRMWPLSIIAGLVVAVALPGLYAERLLAARTAEAALWATDLALRIERTVEVRRSLWAYDDVHLRALCESATRAPVSASVRIDAVRDRVFTAGPEPRSDDVSAWSLIRDRTSPQSGGTVVGRLEVRLDAADARETASTLWKVAVLFGLALTACLILVPLLTVRRADERDAELWAQLEEANAKLDERVSLRTAELAEREAELTALGARLLSVQEQERARISRDLHDELGQTLTALRLRLTTLSQSVPAGAPGFEQLEAALSAVDDGVEQVRGLAHRLRPAALDGLGLADALRAHAERFAAQSGQKVEVHFDPDCAEPSSVVSAVLFRVAQECLTNVARHARATSVQLELSRFDDGWRLVVQDDGIGLNGSARHRTGPAGLGLVGARERVHSAGGYLDLEEVVPNGLRVVAWLSDDGEA